MPGIPDLLIAHPTQRYGALFVEMKTPTGKVSPAQKDTMARLTAAGYRCEVCRTFDEFREKILAYMQEIPKLPHTFVSEITTMCGGN